MSKIVFKKTFDSTESDVFVGDWIASEIELSKIKIKKSIGLGGLWIKKPGKKKKRIKKIKSLISKGDFIEFYHDSNLSFENLDKITPIHEGKSYCVWYKPAGVLSEGTPFSDKGSVLSYIKDKKGKVPFLVHRLDREVAGLIIIAYSKELARHFSEELQKKTIYKKYKAQVMGDISREYGQKANTIDLNLDGKEALTHFDIVNYEDGVSLVDIELETGRFHQIRRHFDRVGFPLIGDPRYGEGNKNGTDGIKLVAYKLRFYERNRKMVEVELPPNLQLF